MSYRYETERPRIFTEEGQRAFLRIRDYVRVLLEKSGAVMMGKIMDIPGQAFDGWFALACVDRLVELEELRELTGPNTMGQHRVFVWGRA